MTRETRFRLSGLIFYLIVASNLLVTTNGVSFIKELFSGSGTNSFTEPLIAVISAGIVIFSSDVIGYVFSLIDVFWWNAFSFLFKRRQYTGYNNSYFPGWESFYYDLQKMAIEKYKLAREKVSDVGQSLHKSFNENWEVFSSDVVLNFFWRNAPASYQDFAGRRNSAFFANGSIKTSIIVADLVSLFVLRHDVVVACEECTRLHLIIYLISFLVLLLAWVSQSIARKEELQFISLWLAKELNPPFRNALNEVISSESISPPSSLQKKRKSPKNRSSKEKKNTGKRKDR